MFVRVGNIALPSFLLTVILALSFVFSSAHAAVAQTGSQTWSCEPATPIASEANATPGSGTPASADPAMMSMDLMFIDMMIPHHESIIALATVAEPRLQDPRLIEIAKAIRTTQSAEITLLREIRQTEFGSPVPAPFDLAMAESMGHMMTGSSSPQDMLALMSPAGLVASFCNASSPDLAFIDLTIAHHTMAVQASEMVLQHGATPEIEAIARDVITAQQAEIDLLTEIRTDISA